MAPPCPMASRLGHSRSVSMVVLFAALAAGRRGTSEGGDKSHWSGPCQTQPPVQNANGSGYSVFATYLPSSIPIAAQMPLHIDPGVRLQPSILQLHFHAVRQFLELGIREPIRFRLVVQRSLERFGHASHDRGLHEHPFAIALSSIGPRLSPTGDPERCVKEN
jgi:hypothetical protein